MVILLNYENHALVNIDHKVISCVVEPIYAAFRPYNVLDRATYLKVAVYAYQVFSQYLRLESESFERNQARELSVICAGVGGVLYVFGRYAINEPIKVLDLLKNSGVVDSDDIDWFVGAIINNHLLPTRLNDLLCKVIYYIRNVMSFTENNKYSKEFDRLVFYHYLKTNRNIPLYVYEDKLVLSSKAIRASNIAGYFFKTSSSKSSSDLMYFNIHNHDKTDTTRKFVVIGVKGEFRDIALPAENPINTNDYIEDNEDNEDVKKAKGNLDRERHLKMMNKLNETGNLYDVLQQPEIQLELPNKINEQTIETQDTAITPTDASDDNTHADASDDNSGDKSSTLTTNNSTLSIEKNLKYFVSADYEEINGVRYIIFDSLKLTIPRQHHALSVWADNGFIAKNEQGGFIHNINGVRLIRIS